MQSKKDKLKVADRFAVNVDFKNLEQSLSANITDKSAVVFSALPQILARGEIVDARPIAGTDHMQRCVIAGAVNIRGEKKTVAVSVVVDKEKYLHLQEIIDTDHNIVYSKDANDFYVDYSGRITPSLEENENATPINGNKKVTAKMDETERSSIIFENEAANLFARKGFNIMQNPAVTGTDRKPDYRIEGRLFDCYAPETITAIVKVRDTIDYKVNEKKTSK